MEKMLLLAVLFFYSFQEAYPQNNPPAFGVRFSGFVRSDIYYDTHENVVFREGLINLYPEAPLYDAQGKDLYEKVNFNFLCLSTRFLGHITGPEALGAKTSGLVEAEFFGTNDADMNGFRLRHAYIDLNWAHTDIRIGQYWHPMFAHECFPQTISFNTGAPFNVFNRSPQIKVTHKVGRLALTAAIATERDFTSKGPDPADPSRSINNTLYIRNSGLPEFQIQGKWEIDSAGLNIAGIGIGTKALRPELYTLGKQGQKYASSEKLVSYSAFGFLKLEIQQVQIRLGNIYCQNAYDLTLLGGYAVKEITDTITGARSFTSMNTFAGWADIQYVKKNWKTGIFTGYTSNLGAAKELRQKIFYSRGSNIDYVYRFAPRFSYSSGKLELNLELEYTVAAYGSVNSKGRVENSKEVANIRPLLTTVYSF